MITKIFQGIWHILGKPLKGFCNNVEGIYLTNLFAFPCFLFYVVDVFFKLLNAFTQALSSHMNFSRALSPGYRQYICTSKYKIAAFLSQSCQNICFPFNSFKVFSI